MNQHKKQSNNFFKYKRNKWLFSFMIFSVITLLISCGGESDGSTPTNNKPISSAGINQSVSTGSTVSLNGMASSDSDGDTLSFQWSFSSLPTSSNAILSDTTSELPTFVADVTGDFVLKLIVNDGTEDSTADLVTITVSEENSLPVANAGSDQNVSIGSAVSLNGTASSDTDGDMLSFQWSFTSLPTGSNAVLSDSLSVVPSFVADVAGNYVLQLIVNDGEEDSASDVVTIIASQENSAPVANAGSDQNVSIGSAVRLDGSASSDIDGNMLSFQWSFSSMPTSSNATLSDTTSVLPTFVADVTGSYVLQLIVNDGEEDGDADVVMITASDENSAPVANAGRDQNVVTGSLVRLDGSASSDADGSSLSYRWSFAVGKGGVNTGFINNPTSVSPSFTAAEAGQYVINLIVNDGIEDSAEDLVLINVTGSNINNKPIANAGSDQNVNTSSLVTLNGTSSTDSDGDTLSYKWSFSSLPTGSSVTLDDVNTVSPSFTADTEGTYVAQLIVNDGTEYSVADSVTITVTFINAAPVAVAGENQNIKSGTVVNLDGSGSSDANGDVLLYTWSFVSKPTSSTAILDDNLLVNPSFTADVDGSYVLSLTVSDGLLNSNVDNITINAAEGVAQLFLENSGGTFNEVVFASQTIVTDLYTSNSEHSLATYKLVAPDSNLTITNVQATELSGLVTPYFESLAEGDVLNSNGELIFTLVTPLIDKTSLNLSFSFDIIETGDTFSSEFDITESDVISPIVRIEPSYPIQAARDGTEGWVKLSFTINEVGGVEDVKVIDANPKRVFDRESTRALGKWKYKPKIVDGIPLKIYGLTVLLEFKLDG